MLTVIGLEVAVVRLMKVNQDRHHFTHRQRAGAAAQNNTAREQMLFEMGRKFPAEIIDMKEQFD